MAVTQEEMEEEPQSVTSIPVPPPPEDEVKKAGREKNNWSQKGMIGWTYGRKEEVEEEP